MTNAAFRVEHATKSSRFGTGVWIVALLIFLSAPVWGERSDLRLLSEMFGYIALATLWNLLAGYAGMISVGQQAYVGIGAYFMQKEG